MDHVTEVCPRYAADSTIRCLDGKPTKICPKRIPIELEEILGPTLVGIIARAAVGGTSDPKLSCGCSADVGLKYLCQGSMPETKIGMLHWYHVLTIDDTA